ncbi:aldo/keto reductase [Streptomyces scopuliridis]|uniref:aldo/keto reductase n=1 Tax=Streptomyces scopuliridis TaxID=452529 RepID=UPI0036B7C631
MPLDSYVTLGRSGLRVSPFCLGAMTFGEDHGRGATEAESAAMMTEYLDRGGNFIDTANMYTNGHSEKIIGDFFAKKSTRRDRTVIGTKFFCNLHEGDPNGGGAGRKAIVDQCEDSLRRLQTDYIDIYWLHNWDRTVPVEETLRCLDDLVTAGKIRYIGFSDIPAWKAAEAQTIAHFRGWSPVVAMQLEYSLLERTAEGELIPMARECGMGVMPWSPLKSGFLSGKYSRENAGSGSVDTRRTGLVGGPREADYDVIEAVNAVAGDLGVPPATVALAWVRGRPGVASTIIGARRLHQFRENLAALDVTLGQEHVDALDEVSKPALDFPADINRDLAPMLAFAGATVDGVPSEVSPMLASSPVRY